MTLDRCCYPHCSEWKKNQDPKKWRKKQECLFFVGANVIKKANFDFFFFFLSLLMIFLGTCKVVWWNQRRGNPAETWAQSRGHWMMSRCLWVCVAMWVSSVWWHCIYILWAVYYNKGCHIHSTHLHVHIDMHTILKSADSLWSST